MEINGKTVKQYLGTGKIAKIFNVAPRTVAKWIDNGFMRGTKIPGSKHRRVAASEVFRFASENNMPVFEEEIEAPKQEILEGKMPQKEDAKVPPMTAEDIIDIIANAPVGV